MSSSQACFGTFFEQKMIIHTNWYLIWMDIDLKTYLSAAIFRIHAVRALWIHAHTSPQTNGTSPWLTCCHIRYHLQTPARTHRSMWCCSGEAWCQTVWKKKERATPGFDFLDVISVIKAAPPPVPSPDVAPQHICDPIVVDHSLSFTWPALKLHLAGARGPVSSG